MSGPKLISPLLDHFAIGEAISEHNGVRCYPAMRDDSDEKYIVKVVSIPASQVQLDALLLTGAYRDQASALAYFKELADSVIQEADVLQKLSKLEGFLAYEGCQIVPMSDGVGYEVYLLGTYKRTLERHMSRNPMTHLGAINLGLDICSALAVCRRAGCMYVDLKPGNIFISENHTYHIGDLGVIPTDALRFASLPDRYRSSYTAPEVVDAFSSLNETMDIYALGLILYQAYNNGELPFEGPAPQEVLPAPMYADYEMSEIILKACHPDPAERWQDPSQMGQALVGYMQRNGATDMPIIPPVTAAETSAEDFLTEELNEMLLPEDNLPEDINLNEQISLDEFQDVEEVIGEEVLTELLDSEDASQESQELPDEDTSEEVPEDAEDLSFIENMVSDETAPDEDTVLDFDDANLTEEMSEILAQADDLISHETPEGVVAPEPIEIPMPEPIVLRDEPEEKESATDEEFPVSELKTENETDSDETMNFGVQSSDPETVATEEIQQDEPKKRGKGWIAVIIILLLLAAIGFCGTYIYQNYYLQNISDLTLDGSGDQLTVTLDTEIPDEDLMVVCTDTYGIATKVAVHDGVASFTGLSPATTYTVTVETTGFHKLIGETTASYTTDSKINVVSFTAITGPSDGSVILNFTVDKAQSNDWILSCTAEGEEELLIPFAGHTVTISELTVGKEYTFTLMSVGGEFLDGMYSITYPVTNVLFAENLHFESLEGNVLTLAWNNPEGYDSLEWNLSHYNSAGEILSMATVTEESIQIELDDLTQENTFELLAANMTQSSKITLSANPITISGLISEAATYPAMNLHWNFDGVIPESGWFITVTADGSEPLEVITAHSNNITMDCLIPGANYELTFETGEGTTIFNNVHSFVTPDADLFDGYWITTSNIEVSLCNTPALETWTYKDLTEEDYSSMFDATDKVSVVLHLDHSHEDSFRDIITTIVIRDAHGIPVSADSSTQTWMSMWDDRYFIKNLGTLPEVSGEYLAEIYFNGNVAGSVEFTIQ